MPVGWIACLMLVATTVATRPAEAGDLTLAEIIERTYEWRASFKTIQIVTREWNRQEFIDYHQGVDPDAAVGKTDYLERQINWADFGASRHELSVVAGGVRTYRSARGSDGKTSWSADTTRDGNPAEWAKVQIEPADPRSGFTFGFMAPLDGIWSHVEGVWFDESLAQSADARLLRYDQLDGRRCAVVRLSRERRRLDYWLDEEYGFVPRQVVASGRVTQGIVTELMGRQFIWHVEEFEQVDGALWFPVKGTFEWAHDASPGTEWIVHYVALDDLIRESFAPPTSPPGVEVTTETIQFAPPKENPELASIPEFEATTFLQRWQGFAAALVVAIVLALMLLVRRRRRALGEVEQVGQRPE